MDTGLHHLQSETRLVTPAELGGILQDFYRETSQLLAARLDRAQSVTAYEANNAYQQVIGRQDVHLRWVADAITDLGGTVPDGPAEPSPAAGSKPDLRAVFEADAREQHRFIDAWRARVPEVTNARHQKMLELILGEMAEHARVFAQALEGRTDMLGRHTDGKVLRGVVMPTRPRD